MFDNFRRILTRYRVLCHPLRNAERSCLIAGINIPYPPTISRVTVSIRLRIGIIKTAEALIEVSRAHHRGKRCQDVNETYNNRFTIKAGKINYRLIRHHNFISFIFDHDIWIRILKKIYNMYFFNQIFIMKNVKIDMFRVR